jgi:antitoxin component YwqK of YwqJK toxin-antitoxin module
MKTKSNLLIACLFWINYSANSQSFFGPFDQTHDNFKPLYQPFLEDGEKPLKFWYHYMVSYSEKEERYILRLFHPEKQLLLSETRYQDKKLEIKDGKSLRVVYSNRSYSVGNFVANNEEGKWVKIDSSGKVRSLYYYAKGKLEGPSKDFFTTGEIEKKGYYLSGKKVGKWQTYHANGKIKEEEIFVEGLSEGENKYYDSTGTLEETWFYEKDKLIKRVKSNQKKLVSDSENGSISNEIAKSEIYTTVDYSPCFIGTSQRKKKNSIDDEDCSTADMYRFLGENIKYPDLAQKLNVSGKVFTKFVIEKDGSVGEVEILTGLCQSLEEESIRVLKMMPKWKPGIQDGKPVRVYYNMPIVYKLD